MSSATLVATPPVPRADALRFSVGSGIIAPTAAAPPLMARRARQLGQDRSSPQDAAVSDVARRDAIAAGRQLLADQHDVVVDSVRFVAARYHLSRDMADELRGRVMLHLAANDYAALRHWRRECTLHTYLVTVVGRVFLDFRNQEWGKAKPPALARRLGPVAMLLWRLTHRKRLSFDEAVETLRADHAVTASRDELWTIYSSLPAPSGRYFVGVSELEQREQSGSEADALVHGAERRRLACKVERALSHALTGLSAEDRLILKLFFTNGMSRAQIARALTLDQQRLYPRFISLMQRLHDALRAQQVTATDVREVIGSENLPSGRAVLEEACKSEGVGPSHELERAPAPRRPRLGES